MRRVLGFLFVLAGASCAIAIGSPTTSKPATATAGAAKPAVKEPPQALHAKASPVRLAPADEYFGPLKMSVLGIRNEIHDLSVRYDVRADGDHALAKRIMGTAVMTEASLADWEKKYPTDNQLARDVYLLQHLYAKIDYDAARTKATFVAKWLLSRYPSTWYAKNMRLTLARATSAPARPTTSAPSESPSGAGGTTSQSSAPGNAGSQVTPVSSGAPSTTPAGAGSLTTTPAASASQSTTPASATSAPANSTSSPANAGAGATIITAPTPAPTPP